MHGIHALFDKIKTHPYLAAGVVFVLGVAVLFYFATSGSGAAVDTGQNVTLDNSGAIQAATALQIAQGQQATAQYQTNAELSAVTVQQNANVAIATLNAQTSQANIAAQLGATISTNDDTLKAIQYQTSGQVQIAGLQAQTVQHQSDNDLAQTQATILGAVQTAQLSSAAAIASAQIAANTVTTTNAQVYNYLTQQSNNQLAAHVNDNETALNTTIQNNQAAVQMLVNGQNGLNALIQSDRSKEAYAGIQANNPTAIALASIQAAAMGGN